MTAQKVFDEHPRGTDSLGVVILSFIEEWLRVPVVGTWIDEHLVRSLCVFHSGEKIDRCLRRTNIFTTHYHQDRTLEPLKSFRIDGVKA